MNTIFKEYHQTIGEYFFTGKEIPRGEIGIEIEVEGTGLPQEISSYWSVHRDGSLRGAENAEYVLTIPTKRDNVLPYLKYLASRLKDSKIEDSIRTSVHVHVNMSEKTILQVYTILIVYFILEELITQVAGEDRVGNLYCLRLKDAEYFLDQLEQAAISDNFGLLFSEASLRYAAVNVCALGKFNSLEFRALRGTTDPLEITAWVDLLTTLIDNSIKFYKTPFEVVRDFSALGPREFCKKILSEHISRFSLQDIDRSTWEGVRLVQGLAYCTPWVHSDYIPKKRLFRHRKKIGPLDFSQEDIGDREEREESREYIYRNPVPLPTRAAPNYRTLLQTLNTTLRPIQHNPPVYYPPDPPVYYPPDPPTPSPVTSNRITEIMNTLDWNSLEPLSIQANPTNMSWNIPGPFGTPDDGGGWDSGPSRVERHR